MGSFIAGKLLVLSIPRLFFFLRVEAHTKTYCLEMGFEIAPNIVLFLLKLDLIAQL